MARPLIAFLLGFLQRLRFPWLFGLVAALFAVDFLVPDILPFVDELLLGSTTLLLGALKKRSQERRGAGHEQEPDQPRLLASEPEGEQPGELAEEANHSQWT